MRRIVLVASVMLVSSTGCESSSAKTDAAPPASADSAPPRAATPARPASQQAEISLEGSPHLIPVVLVRSPEGWTPPFSTYRPEDMIHETTSSDEGDGIRFIANFGAVRNDNAFVHVFFYPAAATEEGVRRTLESYLAGRQERVTEARRYTWTTIERPFTGRTSRGERTTGWIGAGQHAGRWFHIATEYPVEYGDGFGPRSAYILREWIWEDDQSRLIASQDSVRR
jgi:hypothetical protein